MWGLAIIFAWRFIKFLHRFEGKDNRYAFRLLEYLLFGAVIGARLGQVLFYEPVYFMQNPAEIFTLWKGGLASHGGGLGMLLAAWLFCQKYTDYSLWWIVDRLSIGVLFQAGLMRIGNLINSEIVGKTTTLPWAFAFVQRDGFTEPLLYRHPSQVYDMLLVFSLFALFLFWYKKRKFWEPGRFTGLFFALAFSGRTLLEFLKEDAIRTQLLNLPFIMIGMYLLLRRKADLGEAVGH